MGEKDPKSVPKISKFGDATKPQVLKDGKYTYVGGLLKKVDETPKGKFDK